MAVKGVLFCASGKIARIVPFDVKLHGRKERTKSKRNIKKKQFYIIYFPSHMHKELPRKGESQHLSSLSPTLRLKEIVNNLTWLKS